MQTTEIIVLYFFNIFVASFVVIDMSTIKCTEQLIEKYHSKTDINGVRYFVVISNVMQA